MIYAVAVPYAPPSFNDYDKWPGWKQREQKRKWQADMLALLNEKGNKAPRGLQKVRLRSVITFTVTRGRDADNYTMPLYKWSQDALVLAGVLVNDTADHCTFLPPVLIVGQSECTFLTIEEA
jgi:adenosylmethionine-8-amino-7-oxononanoate aminotransferase